MFSGHEQRNANWAQARHQYDAVHAIKSDAQLRTLLDFFHRVRGKLDGFRYKDPLDFDNTNTYYSDNWMHMGMGNASDTDYQIKKYYHAGTDATSRIRDITKPITGTFSVGQGGADTSGGGPSVTAYTEGVDFTIDYTTGILSWTSIPGVTAMWWKGEFDVPVRFDTDELYTTIEAYTANTTNVPLVEIRPTS
jgi:uncharacterized protein (TIGR02217 family)